MTDSISTISNQEWYQVLVEECKAIGIERGFRARLEIVEGKWDLGKRIIDDKNYVKYSRGGGDFISNLAKDIGMSSSDLYDCIKFASEFDKLSNAIETLGKNLSWYKIKTEILGNRTEKKELVKKYTWEEIELVLRDVFELNFGLDLDQVEAHIREVKDKIR